GASVWLVTAPSISYPPLTSRSNQPNGARALRLWLEGLGYHVTELNRRPYAVDADTRLLLVLAPFFPQVTQLEADRLAEGVTGAEPFSNQGLRDPDRAALVLNLVRSIPPGAAVQFDELHHGLAEEEGESILALLLRTTPGRGILLALALGFAYLVLRGRRFGR